MLIGFTKNTSKRLSKLFCKNFKHCAVLFDFDDAKYQYLFVQIGIDGVKIIPISNREIKLLQNAGWVFSNQESGTRDRETADNNSHPFLGGVSPSGRQGGTDIKRNSVQEQGTRKTKLADTGSTLEEGWTKSGVLSSCFNFPIMLTCVGFTKRALSIKNPFIWTPDQLYKYLNNK